MLRYQKGPALFQRAGHPLPNAKDKQTLALLQALVDWQQEDKLFENQQLIRTPIVRNGRQATVGYQPEVWAGWQ